MAKKNNKRRDNEHYYPGTTDDGRRLFGEGVSSGKGDSKTHAYFLGVGYGKARNGEKHLGFRSAEERERFEHGVKNKDKHYIVAGYVDADGHRGGGGFSLGSALSVIGNVLAWPFLKLYELLKCIPAAFEQPKVSKASTGEASHASTPKGKVYKKPLKHMTAKKSTGKCYHAKKR